MISDKTPFMANLVLSYHENNWEKFTKSAPFLTSEVSFLDLSIIIENKKINPYIFWFYNMLISFRLCLFVIKLYSCNNIFKK